MQHHTWRVSLGKEKKDRGVNDRRNIYGWHTVTRSLFVTQSRSVRSISNTISITQSPSHRTYYTLFNPDLTFSGTSSYLTTRSLSWSKHPLAWVQPLASVRKKCITSSRYYYHCYHMICSSTSCSNIVGDHNLFYAAGFDRTSGFRVEKVLCMAATPPSEEIEIGISKPLQLVKSNMRRNNISSAWDCGQNPTLPFHSPKSRSAP